MLVKDAQGYLTIEDIARRLNVEPSTVRRWLRTRRMIGYQFGRQWRVRPDDFERFVRDSRNLGDQPRTEPNTEKRPIIRLPEYGEEVSG